MKKKTYSIVEAFVSLKHNTMHASFMKVKEQCDKCKIKISSKDTDLEHAQRLGFIVEPFA